MPQNTHVGEVQSFTSKKDKKRQAFKELDAARAQIKMYLPDDFDPDMELEKARAQEKGQSSEVKKGHRNILQS